MSDIDGSTGPYSRYSRTCTLEACPRRRSTIDNVHCLLATARWPALPAAILPIPFVSFVPSAVLGGKRIVTWQTTPPSLGVLSHHRGHQTFHLTIPSQFPPPFPLLRLLKRPASLKVVSKMLREILIQGRHGMEPAALDSHSRHEQVPVARRREG